MGELLRFVYVRCCLVVYGAIACLSGAIALFHVWTQPAAITFEAGVASTELYDSCTKAVGDCQVTGPLAAIGIGTACWGWRGSSTCHAGSCECDAPKQCGGVDGFCRDFRDWDEGFLARGVRFSSRGHTLTFNVSDMSVGVLQHSAADEVGTEIEDRFYVYRIPGSDAGAPLLFGPDQHLQWSVQPAEEFERAEGWDCFEGQDDSTVDGDVEAAKEECIKRGCSAFVVHKGTAYLRPPSVTADSCRNNKVFGRDRELFVRDPQRMMDNSRPAMTNVRRESQGVRLEPRHYGGFSIVVVGGAMDGWCLEISGAPEPPRWSSPRFCGASWSLHPPSRRQSWARSLGRCLRRRSMRGTTTHSRAKRNKRWDPTR